MGRGSIWSDGKGCAVGAFPSRMTVGMLIESMSSSIDAGLSASSLLKAFLIDLNFLSLVSFLCLVQLLDLLVLLLILLGSLFVVEDVGRGSIWSDGKGCAVGAFPSRMTVGMLIES